MTNNLIDKIYLSLNDYEKTKINKLNKLDKYKKISEIKKKIQIFKFYGGDVISNTYNKNKIEELNKEIVIIDNNEYFYNIGGYSSFGDNENMIIDIVSIKKKDYNNNDYICGSIQIDKNTLIATIIGLGNEYKCVKLKNGNDVYKNGDIVFQIMLDICKKENIKQINLTDNSYKKCGDIEINLNVLKIMTYGKTHYMKYGFKFKKKSELTKYEYNKKIFDLDPKVNKIDLINLIRSSKTNIETKQYIIGVLHMSKSLDISIKYFLLLLMSKKNPNNENLEDKNYCQLIYDIYDSLFEIGNYKMHVNNDYYLNL